MTVLLVALGCRTDTAAASASTAPPATTATAAPAGPTATAASASGATADQGQGPLAANGFASPWCEDPGVVARLSAPSRSNCTTSGVAAAPAPIGNYQFDVHIDSGPLGLGGTMFAIALQDLILTPLWTALVWLVHALLVALEWCYSLDLLGGGAVQIGDALRTAEATFTQPWLSLALAVAAVLLVYQGIVRRRVADSVGQAALTMAMIVAGLCLIADPTGTVGEVSRVVNEASLGTVAAIDAGTPNHPERTFAGALAGVFETTVTAPWCYLEFGNVAWCSDPARVDPRLRAAAARIAADDRGSPSCPSSVGPAPAAGCGQVAGRTAASLRLEASLLARARTNGEFVVALPANGPLRNSINDTRSLLRVICGTADATACVGPAAAEAEFRTQSGTWPRAGGLLFVTIGIAGALALFGFIALRLFSAALLAVLYLLLAPVAVLAPAFGDGGRAVFRQWSARLLGALVAKLVYSVLLGVVLLMLRVLLSMDALGWWTQWLLIAAFWWVAFLHRHQLLGQLFGEQPRGPRYPRLAPGRGLMRLARAPRRAATSAAGTILERMRELPVRDAPDGGPRRDGGPSGGADHRHDAPADSYGSPALSELRAAPRDRGAGLDPQSARHALDDQLQRLLDAERAEAAAIVSGAGDGRGDPGADQQRRRERLAEQITAARRDGHPRRLVSLQSRLAAVDAGIQERQAAIREARATLAATEDGAAERALNGGARSGGSASAGSLRERRARDLDHQALLPRPGEVNGANGPGGRDYASLTALAGVGRAEYRRMVSADQRRVRIEIDRELERRREWSAAASQNGAREARPVVPSPDDSGSQRPPVTPRATHTDSEPVGARPTVRSARERQFTREEFEELVG